MIITKPFLFLFFLGLLSNCRSNCQIGLKEKIFFLVLGFGYCLVWFGLVGIKEGFYVVLCSLCLFLSGPVLSAPRMSPASCMGQERRGEERELST